MKVIVIVGTRPEAIKMAPVVFALREAGCQTVLCSTGQHKEMLQQALDVFGLEPDVSLDVMRENQTLNGLASRLISALDLVCEEQNPDWVLVQGDTTSAFCGAFAAFQRGIKIGHVEAGLRTGDLASPFPEEANRSLIGRIATLHFAPTKRAKLTLVSEGISEGRIQVTGNTVVDAIEYIRNKPEFQNGTKLSRMIDHKRGAKEIILLTIHRREIFGEAIEAICHTIKKMCSKYPGFHWVFPVHLNPKVREPVQRILGRLDNLTILSPIDYITNLKLISNAILIISDSGGIQEEAPSFGVPLIVMRDHTERLEAVEAKLAVLAGINPMKIEAAVENILNKRNKSCGNVIINNPYGDGKAAELIVTNLFKMRKC